MIPAIVGMMLGGLGAVYALEPIRAYTVRRTLRLVRARLEQETHQ